MTPVVQFTQPYVKLSFAIKGDACGGSPSYVDCSIEYSKELLEQAQTNRATALFVIRRLMESYKSGVRGL